MKPCSRRGSALVFVVGTLFATLVLLLATVELSMSGDRVVQREHEDAQARWIDRSLEAAIFADADSGALNALPVTRTVSLAGKPFTYNVATGTASRSYRVTSSYDLNSRMRTVDAPVAGRHAAHPIYFALFTQGNLNLGTRRLTTIGSNASVGTNGTASFGTGSSIQGDLFSSNISSCNEVEGNCFLRTLPKYTWVRSDYQTSLIPFLLTSLLGVTFGTVSAGSFLQGLYLSSAATMSGTLTGQGTVFVNGNLTINGNVMYANSSSRALIIVEGNMTVNSGVTTLAGSYLVKGNINILTSGTLNVSRGNLVSYGSLTCTGADLAITHDPYLCQYRNEAYRHRSPGFWPTSDTNLVRP